MADDAVGNPAGISLVEEEDSPVNSSINTTPLVDIMLVLLIIFLITVPVAVGLVNVQLPQERNVVVQTRKENVNLAVSSDGSIYWNLAQVSEDQLAQRLAVSARQVPQPEVHIRGDLLTEYYQVGRVVAIAQKSGILKIGFITKAPPPGQAS
ncbi:MAG: biopolymer transporter ExbD [Hyphomonadaceae bacterium]